jgi:3'-5' exoribonuclease
MARRFVSDLGQQENIDQVFMASQKQMRPNRNGNLYLQVELSDRSGAISARMWNASDADYRSFEDGDLVRVEGATQIFQGGIQLIATSICKARHDEVDLADFMCLTPADIDRLALRLAEMLRSMRDLPLRNLAECLLSDEEFMEKLARSPAGIKNHHAYPGGLLEHVVNLMEVADSVAGHYPILNRDLLLMGVFLHDIGKVEELSSDRGFAYTDAGQLLGHVILAISMLDKKLAQAEELMGEPLPSETILRLKHMIVSHHGEYEYGAPKLPMTLEAIALHQLDNLDAKLHNFHQLMRDDANLDSSWTQYHANLGRKLFKGQSGAEVRSGQ